MDCPFRSRLDPKETFGCLPDPAARRLLSIFRILAVVGQEEIGRGRFMSPNRLPSSLRTLEKILITFGKVSIYGRLGMFDTRIVTIVNDGASHSAKNGLNNVQKLRARWQRQYPNIGSTIILGPSVQKFYLLKQLCR